MQKHRRRTTTDESAFPNYIKNITLKLDGFLELLKYHFQPPYTKGFQVSGMVSATQNAGAVWPVNGILICSVTVPWGYEGVLKAIGIESTNIGYFDNTNQWGVLINSAPLIYWNNLTMQKGSITRPAAVTYPLAGGDIIQITAINATIASTCLISGYLSGWFMPATVQNIEKEDQ